MKITIKHNGFHGWSIRAINVKGQPGDVVELTESQVNRLKNAACGVSDCRCGESMLAVCEEGPRISFEPRFFIRIPADGAEIRIAGNYPQR